MGVPHGWVEGREGAGGKDDKGPAGRQREEGGSSPLGEEALVVLQHASVEGHGLVDRMNLVE